VVTKQIHHNNYGWSNPCHFNDFFSLFAPYPDREITKLICSSSEWFKWPIYKCNPMKTINEMTKNSIILLGDAAHYMKPHLAQGACMALEDSDQISYFLKRINFNKQVKWNSIFTAITKKRIKRINKVQKRSIRNGYIFQCTGILRLLRNFILKIFGNLVVDQKWLFKKHL
jgi:2-polyprenyl-6-methoxyphenol hydroxylase-like FAD-dependent oxidoreductase